MKENLPESSENNVISSPQLLAEKLRDKQKKGEIPQIARLGDILSLAGIVTKEFIMNIIKNQLTEKKKVGELLIESGYVTEDQVTTALAIKFRLDFVDLEKITPTIEALSSITASFARKNNILPLWIKNNVLCVAISTPANSVDIQDALGFSLNKRINIVVASAFQISRAIGKYYSRETPKNADNTKGKKTQVEGSEEYKGLAIDSILDKMADDASVVFNQEETVVEEYESDSLVINLVNTILISAVSQRASDVHFESRCQNKHTLVRFRIDGICHDAHSILPLYERAIISRIKILSNLNIAERRKPQSGKIKMNYYGGIIEFRVEITPTLDNSEDAVLRVLSHASALPLEKLGFSESNLHKFKEIVDKPYGIILCVGPTGSGKTTTLHAALGYINTPERKIWTAEDPVEITQNRLRQVQIKPDIGFTFQEALRSFLRADPDVIMIGEMRDKETTRTAIEASLTGHLVFSTLHTNSAAETIGRLLEMGIEPYNFADSLLAILAQRLTRRICSHCKIVEPISEEDFALLLGFYGESIYKQDNLPMDLKEIKIASPGKCQSCNDLGYHGRLALHELLVNNDEIKMAIQQNERTKVIHDLALKEGMRPLRSDGIQKVLQQLTSIKEILRVTV